jgi:hypothetical protein
LVLRFRREKLRFVYLLLVRSQNSTTVHRTCVPSDVSVTVTEPTRVYINMLCSFQVHYYDNLSQVGSLLENDLFLILLQLSWLNRDRVVVAFQIAVSFERIFNLTIRGAHSAELEVLKLALTNYLISLLFFATKPE